MSVMTLAVIVVRFDLARFFFGTGPQGFAAVELAATLMLVGATFFIADGIQTVAAGALRGLSDTRIPLLLAALSYWAIGFTTACAFAFWLNFGAVGVWCLLCLTNWHMAHTRSRDLQISLTSYPPTVSPDRSHT